MSTIRRDKGGGSLRLRSNGLWEARFSYTDDFGQRISKSVYAPTRSEVKRKLKDLVYKVEVLEKELGVIAHDMLVNEWLDIWLRDYKKKSVSPATYASYHVNADTHIRPQIGMVELQKIRTHHIQRVLNYMGQEKADKKALSPWTVIKIKNIMSGAFEQAVRNQLILVNPVKGAVSPKMEQKEIRTLTQNEQKQFLEVCKGHRLEALYTLALATGMRRGEVLALTWDNIDFKKKTILVKSSVSRINDPDTNTTDFVFSSPKTQAGRRSIPLMDSLIPILKAHKERQDIEKSQAGSAWNERNLVFCSTVGKVIEPRRIAVEMERLTKMAGLDHFTFHSLRHSFATRMLEANVSAKVVQDILGHTDVTLTLNTYSHVIGTTAHEQIAKINNLFANKEAEQPSIKEKINEAKGEARKGKPPTGKSKKIKEQTIE